MKTLFLSFSKQVGTLYHYTSKTALLNMLRSGKLELSAGRGMLVEGKHVSGRNYFASFTRSRFGGYHYREGERGPYGDTDVMITLNGDSLSHNNKIVQIDYWEQRGQISKEFARNKEYEERLVSNKPSVDIIKHIERVDLIQPAVHLHEKTDFFDKNKKEFKLKINDRYQKMLGSIILQLKKHKIPYSFYNSIEDWAKKRNPYSYTGPKEAHVAGPSKYNKSTYDFRDLSALIECLSDKPYEQLSENAQKICYDLYNHPSDADSKFSAYENNRKPNAEEPNRSLALRLARTMQRHGFKTKKEAADFIRNKIHVYYEEQRRKKDEKEANLLAPLYEQALLLPKDQWEDVNHYNNPKNVLLDIKDTFGYSYDNAVRVIKKILSFDYLPSVKQLKNTMEKMDIDNPDSFVYKFYRENKNHGND